MVAGNDVVLTVNDRAIVLDEFAEVVAFRLYLLDVALVQALHHSSSSGGALRLSRKTLPLDSLEWIADAVLCERLAAVGVEAPNADARRHLERSVASFADLDGAPFAARHPEPAAAVEELRLRLCLTEQSLTRIARWRWARAAVGLDVDQVPGTSDSSAAAWTVGGRASLRALRSKSTIVRQFDSERYSWTMGVVIAVRRAWWSGEGETRACA